MADHDPMLERIIDTLREPVDIDPALDQRVLAQIAAEAPVRRSSAWLTPRWTIRLSPLGALAAAAALAALMLGGSYLLRPAAPRAAASADVQAPGQAVTQFVLVAPGAHNVALVGDFNDWNVGATQLVRQADDGVWWVTVKLPPGRYRYAFVVDGTIWQSDPNASGVEDEFGRRNSVVTVGGV